MIDQKLTHTNIVNCFLTKVLKQFNEQKGQSSVNRAGMGQTHGEQMTATYLTVYITDS